MDSKTKNVINDDINISDITYLTKNDARYGIITAIRLYGALNLKKMSRILGKSETTLIHHLHELLDKGFIEQLDRKKLGKKRERGKFYGLTIQSKKINDLLVQEYWQKDYSAEIESMKSKTAEEYNKTLILQLKSLAAVFSILNLKAGAALNKSITDITTQELVNAIDVLKSDKELKLPLGSTNIYLNSIPVGNHQHVLRIVELTVEYLRNLTEIESEIRNELKMTRSKNTENASQFQYVYLFTAPISSDLHDKDVS
jgi:DNA-binding Lrp family transcriptional regulator